MAIRAFVIGVAFFGMTGRIRLNRILAVTGQTIVASFQ
jgi:hypothetical protein